jgi:hypothetical protein
LRCHSFSVKALAAASLGRLRVRRFDKTEKDALVLYERDAPTAGLFGWHFDSVPDVAKSLIEDGVRRAIKDGFLKLRE